MARADVLGTGIDESKLSLQPFDNRIEGAIDGLSVGLAELDPTDRPVRIKVCFRSPMIDDYPDEIFAFRGGLPNRFGNCDFKLGRSY